MKFRVEGYDMSKEEMISRIVELTVENSVLNLKIVALTGLLMEKGLLSVEEIEESYKKITDKVHNYVKVQGVDPEHYLKYAKWYLGLEDDDEES